MTPCEKRLLINIGKYIMREHDKDIALFRAVVDCEIELRNEVPPPPPTNQVVKR